MSVEVGNLKRGIRVDKGQIIASLVGRNLIAIDKNVAKISDFFTCTQNRHIDNAFVNLVTFSYSALKRQGGVLKLLSPGKQFRDLLEESKLVTVFEIYYDEDEAVRSFSDPAARG